MDGGISARLRPVRAARRSISGTRWSNRARAAARTSSGVGRGFPAPR